MGTQYHITLIPKSHHQTDYKKIKKQVDALLLKINQQMSTYIPSSEISQFNQYKQLDWFPVSKDFAFVASNAQNVSKLSQGAFDITVAPLIDLWGFGAKTQLAQPTDIQIATALKNTGYQLLNVRTSPPALRKLNKNLHIDLSAIAKGFAVDKLAELLNNQNYSDYLVEIGGELHNKGFNPEGKPWKIGIESPGNNEPQVKQTLFSSNISMATSGDYRNYFIKDGIRYSHTIDPNTGRPITHNLASATVLHQSTMMADAFATALMVLGDTKGKTFTNDGKLRVNLITREKSGYQTWGNINQSKISQSTKRCEKNDGCLYLP